MTRRLRHRLGRWLLRDSTRVVVPLGSLGRDPVPHWMLCKVGDEGLVSAMVNRDRKRGGGSVTFPPSPENPYA